MADEPVTNTPAAGQPPVAAPETKPVAAPPSPASPAPPPPALAEPQPTLLPYETKISLDMPDGSVQERFLGDIVKEVTTVPKFTPEELADFQLYQKARAGDVQAMMAIAMKETGKNAPAAPPLSLEEQVAQANQRIAQLESISQQNAAFVAEGRQRTTLAQLNVAISTMKDQIPHLARWGPKGGELLANYLQPIIEAAAREGKPFHERPLQERVTAIRTSAFAVEKQLADIATMYKDFSPLSPATPKPPAQANPVVEDDQKANAGDSDVLMPARWQRGPDGRFVDTSGNKVTQMGNTQVVSPDGNLIPIAAKSKAERLAAMRERFKQAAIEGQGA
jgi:hypothetical protein